MNTRSWCTCISDRNWKKQDGWVPQFNQVIGETFWVHNRCGKMSKACYDLYVNEHRVIPDYRTMSCITGYGDPVEIELFQDARDIVFAELEWEGHDEEEETDGYDEDTEF